MTESVIVHGSKNYRKPYLVIDGGGDRAFAIDVNAIWYAIVFARNEDRAFKLVERAWRKRKVMFGENSFLSIPDDQVSWNYIELEPGSGLYAKAEDAVRGEPLEFLPNPVEWFVQNWRAWLCQAELILLNVATCSYLITIQVQLVFWGWPRFLDTTANVGTDAT